MNLFVKLYIFRIPTNKKHIDQLQHDSLTAIYGLD